MLSKRYLRGKGRIDSGTVNGVGSSVVCLIIPLRMPTQYHRALDCGSPWSFVSKI